MGRITVFTIQDCPHCLRSKKYLDNRSVPFVEISLSTHPSKRNDMLSLSDRLTVPQFFFNEDHIGGADDLIQFVEDMESTTNHHSFLSYYESEIQGKDESTDARLDVPTSPPVTTRIAPPREYEQSIPMPGGEMASVLEVTLLLTKLLPREDKRFNWTVYKKSFTGTKFVQVVMEHFSITEEEAIQFGSLLKDEPHKVLTHVAENDRHSFVNQGLYYRLQCYHTPSVLNSFRIWNERVDIDFMSLLQRLKKRLGQIEVAVTNENDGTVQYSNARHQHPQYSQFEDAVCELQGVDMSRMNRDTRLAFGINLYNVMIKYAFMKVGIATTASSRNAFFSNVQFNIGGALFSFNDLEHGILRGNKRPAYGLTPQFNTKTDQTRASLALPDPDCRIHFALNCGAKSCPPIKNFTADAIDEELRIVAQSFAEQEENVRMDETTNKVYLTKILSWFRADFSTSKELLPSKVLTFLRGDKRDKLQRMISSKPTIRIEFNIYDWGTNASHFEPFDNNTLTINSKTLKNIIL